MNEVNQHTVAAVVLCYGDRQEYLAQSLNSIEKNAPGRLILVGNAVSDRVREEMEMRASWNNRCTTVFSAENLGSAGGYALGIDTALKFSDCDFIWLLDDDNNPHEDALGHLLTCWHTLSSPQNTAIVARRETMFKQPDSLYGWAGALPRNGTCIGFHIMNLVPWRGRRTRAPQSLPWSVYGGLLLPCPLIRRIGLPKQDFFLYGDDLEWTLRITVGGGRIIPCPPAKITDLCPSWQMTGEKGSNLRRRIRDLEAFRVYYEVRNRTWIARRYFPGNIAVYWINRSLYLLTSWVLALRYQRKKRFALVKQALRDGEIGKLGQMPEDYFHES